MIMCGDDWLNDDVNWCNCVTISSEFHVASKGMLNAWLKNVHHTLLTCAACFSQESDQSHPCFLFCCNTMLCLLQLVNGASLAHSFPDHFLLQFWRRDQASVVASRHACFFSVMLTFVLKEKTTQDIYYSIQTCLKPLFIETSRNADAIFLSSR